MVDIEYLRQNKVVVRIYSYAEAKQLNKKYPFSQFKLCKSIGLLNKDGVHDYPVTINYSHHRAVGLSARWDSFNKYYQTSYSTMSSWHDERGYTILSVKEVCGEPLKLIIKIPKDE